MYKAHNDMFKNEFSVSLDAMFVKL